MSPKTVYIVRHGQSVWHTTAIDNPILFENPNGTVVVGYYEDGALRTLPNIPYQALYFYPHAADPINIVQVKRTMDPPAQADSFYTDSGFTFGKLEQTPPNPAGPQMYTLSFTGNHWSLISLTR